jgi:hypothetical protein
MGHPQIHEDQTNVATNTGVLGGGMRIFSRAAASPPWKGIRGTEGRDSAIEEEDDSDGSLH